MSYILDALRKSETERRQGKVPDLGQQVQLIHKPRKKRSPAALWIAVALIINAAVLLVIFWPSVVPAPDARVSGTVPEGSNAQAVTQAEPQTEVAPKPAPEPEPAQEPEPEQLTPQAAVAESGEAESRLRPTIIVPNRSVNEPVSAAQMSEPVSQERVPHLVELPLPFQKSIPDLIFNSHIYASEPAARRVMINNQYMRVGDTFSGIRVERITEDGVELSKDGRRFRVGVVRDWMSPR